MVIQTGDNKFGVAKWIVDPTAGLGTHTTVEGALISASSGDTIFIRPGTYTEDTTLKAGVNLSAFPCDALTPNVTIVGQMGATFAGTCTISGICLKTNSAPFLNVSGSNATIVQLENCVLFYQNANALTYTSSSSSSKIVLDSCQFTTTTGFTLFTANTTGFIHVRYCTDYDVTAQSNTTTASTITNGGVFFEHCLIRFPVTITSGSGTFNFTESNVVNAACLTLVTSGQTNIQGCLMGSGNASVISVGSGCTVVVSRCTMTTSNTNAITGAGTATVDALGMIGTSGQILNATTMNAAPFGRYNTWTPVLQFGGASTGITYSLQTGQYWVVGKLVYFMFQLTLSNKGSATGNATIVGSGSTALPGSSTVDQTFQLLTTNGTYPGGCTFTMAVLGSGGTTISLRGVGAGAFPNMDDTNFTNSSTIQMSGFYWMT